ncbi:MAG TPA: hypothetical protein PKA00_01055 [Saprospiraceae bacterium]|nr:hypothetical protein [Saprospiraceae bacterium]HMQ81455.1 hypothetical protein [Saprospiraceae bacterium]
MNIVKGILIFLVILFVGDRLISFVLDQVVSRSKFRYVRLYEGKMKEDVVMIGNSRGVNSFYTPYLKKQYGINAVNLSYNGLPTKIATTFLEDYIEQQQKPKAIFIEVSSLFVKYDFTKKSAIQYNFFSPYSEKLNGMVRESGQWTYLLYNLFGLTRFNSEFFFRALAYMKNDDATWINRYRIKPAILKMTEKMDDFDVYLNEASLQHLADFLEYADQQNIEVRLVLAPYLPMYQEKMRNLDEVIATVESKTNKKIYNYSHALDKIEYFSDRVHTNDNGANVLSDRMYEDGLFSLD